ncbi:hypothetical protein AMTR_s00057p00142820 [Amborella trichopoda]|uniref:Uncharacterized protein n=1 Tax=Amborella trichopoda TaxID=13333 RepID=U5D604_AMBTC|nr:hypothetical protein AMTR_s00057p00142820 [Amborella trichopoda]
MLSLFLSIRVMLFYIAMKSTSVFSPGHHYVLFSKGKIEGVRDVNADRWPDSERRCLEVHEDCHLMKLRSGCVWAHTDISPSLIDKYGFLNYI